MLRSLFVNIVGNFIINHGSAFKWLKDFKYVVHNYMDYFSDANHHTESRQYGRATYDFKKNVFIMFWCCSQTSRGILCYTCWLKKWFLTFWHIWGCIYCKVISSKLHFRIVFIFWLIFDFCKVCWFLTGLNRFSWSPYTSNVVVKLIVQLKCDPDPVKTITTVQSSAKLSDWITTSWFNLLFSAGIKTPNACKHFWKAS